MSCVNYWIDCKDCKTESYERNKSACPKCGSTNVSIQTEWDEQGDHHDEPMDGWGSDE